MRRITVREQRDRRFLGAVRFVDGATGAALRKTFDIKAEGLRFIVNPSYLHVITSAPGFEKYTASFFLEEDQPTPPAQEFTAVISDPSHQYLPRVKHIDLPRNPEPRSEESLFEPMEVAMFSASCGSLSPNWSILRVSVAEPGEGGAKQAPGGVLLRVLREEDGSHIASGLTDQRGEALVIIPGIPWHTFVTAGGQPEDELDHEDWLASGAVIEKETAVKLEAVVDRTLPWPVDPEVLEENRNEWLCEVKRDTDSDWDDYVNLKLKTGQTQIITLFVKIPGAA